MRLVVAMAVAAVMAAVAGPAAAHQPPVDGEIIDGFRPPAEPWGAGNRGVDYATTPGTAVAASAAGDVVFAGQVGGDLHVTVAHPDGLRTTYSGLVSLAVVEGQSVGAGDQVGVSGARFHFGVRDAAGTYLDPTALFVTTVARLVPGGDDGAVVVAGPGGAGLWAVVWDLMSSGMAVGGGPAVGVLADAGGVLPVLAHYADQVGAAATGEDLRAILAAATADTGPCTDAGVAAPAPAGRRIAVLVAGFGSTSQRTGIDGVDTVALGYDPGDVVRFSYRGGRIPADTGAVGPLGGVTTTTYGSADANGDLAGSGQALVGLLAELAAAAPGVPIDVVAHSQGGVVARLGIGNAVATDTLPDSVATLVTLGSPHGGADLATAGSGLAATDAGAAVLDLAGGLGLPVSSRQPALHQLSELSPVATADRSGELVASRLAFTSVAARGDPVVPVARTRAGSAATTTVSVGGLSAHDDLPAASATTREIALAVAGLPPTCRSVADRVVDEVSGRAVAGTHDAAGAVLVGLAAAL